VFFNQQKEFMHPTALFLHEKRYVPQLLMPHMLSSTFKLAIAFGQNENFGSDIGDALSSIRDFLSPYISGHIPHSPAPPACISDSVPKSVYNQQHDLLHVLKDPEAIVPWEKTTIQRKETITSDKLRAVVNHADYLQKSNVIDKRRLREVKQQQRQYNAIDSNTRKDIVSSYARNFKKIDKLASLLPPLPDSYNYLLQLSIPQNSPK